MTEPDPSDRPWLRSPVAIAVAAALVLAGGWWSTSASRFSPVGNGAGAHTAVGQAVLFSAELLPTSDVVLRRAKARVGENTADAIVRVVFCVDTPSYGVYTQTAKEHCHRVIPISGAHLPKDPGKGSQLMVEVTTRRAGAVVIDGVDVSYRSGLRWGSEASGWVMRVETR